MGNDVVRHNYQISFNYTSPAMMDCRLGLNYKREEMAREDGACSWISQALVFPPGRDSQQDIPPSPGNIDWLVRIVSVIGLHTHTLTHMQPKPNTSRLNVSGGRRVYFCQSDG